jgi:hypothetical protein
MDKKESRGLIAQDQKLHRGDLFNAKPPFSWFRKTAVGHHQSEGWNYFTPLMAA